MENVERANRFWQRAVETKLQSTGWNDSPILTLIHDLFPSLSFRDTVVYLTKIAAIRTKIYVESNLARYLFRVNEEEEEYAWRWREDRLSLWLPEHYARAHISLPQPLISSALSPLFPIALLREDSAKILSQEELIDLALLYPTHEKITSWPTLLTHLFHPNPTRERLLNVIEYWLGLSAREKSSSLPLFRTWLQPLQSSSLLSFSVDLIAWQTTVLVELAIRDSCPMTVLHDETIIAWVIALSSRIKSSISLLDLDAPDIEPHLLSLSPTVTDELFDYLLQTIPSSSSSPSITPQGTLGRLQKSLLVAKNPLALLLYLLEPNQYDLVLARFPACCLPLNTIQRKETLNRFRALFGWQIPEEEKFLLEIDRNGSTQVSLQLALSWISLLLTSSSPIVYKGALTLLKECPKRSWIELEQSGWRSIFEKLSLEERVSFFLLLHHYHNKESVLNHDLQRLIDDLQSSTEPTIHLAKLRPLLPSTLYHRRAVKSQLPTTPKIPKLNEKILPKLSAESLITLAHDGRWCRGKDPHWKSYLAECKKRGLLQKLIDPLVKTLHEPKVAIRDLIVPTLKESGEANKLVDYLLDHDGVNEITLHKAAEFPPCVVHQIQEALSPILSTYDLKQLHHLFRQGWFPEKDLPYLLDRSLKSEDESYIISLFPQMNSLLPIVQSREEELKPSLRRLLYKEGFITPPLSKAFSLLSPPYNAKERLLLWQAIEKSDEGEPLFWSRLHSLLKEGGFPPHERELLREKGSHLIFNWVQNPNIDLCVKITLLKVLLEPPYSIIENKRADEWVTIYHGIIPTKKEQSRLSALAKEYCKARYQFSEQQEQLHFFLSLRNPMDHLELLDAPLASLQGISIDQLATKRILLEQLLDILEVDKNAKKQNNLVTLVKIVYDLLGKIHPEPLSLSERLRRSPFLRLYPKEGGVMIDELLTEQYYKERHHNDGKELPTFLHRWMYEINRSHPYLQMMEKTPKLLKIAIELWIEYETHHALFTESSWKEFKQSYSQFRIDWETRYAFRQSYVPAANMELLAHEFQLTCHHFSTDLAVMNQYLMQFLQFIERYRLPTADDNTIPLIGRLFLTAALFSLTKNDGRMMRERIAEACERLYGRESDRDRHFFALTFFFVNGEVDGLVPSLVPPVNEFEPTIQALVQALYAVPTPAGLGRLLLIVHSLLSSNRAKIHDMMIKKSLLSAILGGKIPLSLIHMVLYSLTRKSGWLSLLIQRDPHLNSFFWKKLSERLQLAIEEEMNALPTVIGELYPTLFEVTELIPMISPETLFSPPENWSEIGQKLDECYKRSLSSPLTDE